MDSPSSSHRVQTAKYPALVYFILIAVVSETLFIHFKAASQSDKLRLRIDDLEKELSINKGELAELRSVGSNGKNFYVNHINDLHKNIQSRVRRGILKNSQSFQRALDEVRIQVLQLINKELGPKYGCENVSLVCKKGERGPQGSMGPRGFKGDSGSKGDRGVAGEKGQTGPPGAIGQKGQKGDRGQPGTSVEEPNTVTNTDRNYAGGPEKSFLLQLSAPRDCSGLKGTRNSGIYTINPDGKQPFRVFCDMQTTSGGWTVIQRRIDGSVNFFKNWVDYKHGFGNVDKEFWLGNDRIHRLTNGRNMTIRFDLEDANGIKVYAEYKMFYIDGEDANYKAHVGAYSGTAGDSFSYANGMQFTTKDRDNDIYHRNCAAVYHGAWWYTKCHHSNLNGMYLYGRHSSYANGINWYHFRGHYNSLKKTEMKVRPAV